MARGRVAFKERDLARALRGTAKAGLRVQRVKIDRDGRIVLIFDKGQSVEAEGANPWDRL